MRGVRSGTQGVIQKKKNRSKRGENGSEGGVTRSALPLATRNSKKGGENVRRKEKRGAEG